MKSLSVFAFFCLVVWATGCSSPSPQSSASPEITPIQPAANLPKGEIIDDPAGYSLYLPEAYTPDHSWPIVFCFDAQGRGRLPLKRYAPLAEMQGIVLAGSNRSKNGFSPQQSLSIAGEMIASLQQKLKLDSRRQYTAGFSGGARVAAAVAQNRTDISGVITCGAGFQPGPQDQFGFVGIVGMEDFNYQELRQLDNFLDANGRPHLAEYAVGGHEWASVNTMAKGLQWLYFRAMLAGSVPKSDTAIDNMMVKVRYQDEQLKQNGTNYQRWLLRKKVISYLDGLTDISGLKKERDELRMHPETVAELRRQEEELLRENQMRRQYSQALQGEDIAYWERVAGMLGKVSRKGTRTDAWLNKRVLNFLSLSAYLNANSMLQAQAWAQADRMLAIYALVDPTNPEHAYLTAVLRMRQSRQDEAWASLQQAVDLGHGDALRLQADADLAPLRNKEAFPELLARVKENHDW